MQKTIKRKGKDKFKRLRIEIEPTTDPLAKPAWLRVKAPSDPKVSELKALLREHKLHSVCEEASCPNLSECFSHGTATFMIMGDICTRRCAFCDVAHGRPGALDPDEPINLARALGKMGLKYIVITSVDRDDLPDGGAAHFAACIHAIREHCPHIKIEILTPDFRNRVEIALDHLASALPDVFNHNVETVESLYKAVRPGSVYAGSLQLIKEFKLRNPQIPTKSGLMLGLGETNEQIKQVIKDLKAHHCDMLTLGQYLQPTKYHAPVHRYVTPAEFAELAKFAEDLGFMNVASGPLVRSSYHADLQAAGTSQSESPQR